MPMATFHVTPEYATILAELGIDSAQRVFSDDRLRIWRNLPDRDNSTLDATLASGRTIRLHVKRDKEKRSEPMALEARGIGLLASAGIASAPLVAYGDLVDGRTFVITENLDGFLSADRLIETGVDLGPVLDAMCDVAARLHLANLHHRDLYANHFYMKPRGNEASRGAPGQVSLTCDQTDSQTQVNEYVTPGHPSGALAGGYDVRLIDTARVKPLPGWFRERWIVKDVAQLHFSIGPYARSPEDSNHLLRRYCELTRRHAPARFLRRVKIKSQWIERHDAALKLKKPMRNLRLQDGN